VYNFTIGEPFGCIYTSINNNIKGGKGDFLRRK